MAVVFDAITTSQVSDSSTNSFNHTPAAAPSAVFVRVSWWQPTPASLTSVTYGGSAMTFLVGQTDADFNRVEIWGKATTATGSQAVVVSFNSAGGGAYSYASATTVTGSDPSTLTTGTAANLAANDTPTVTVTSAVDDLVLDALCGTAHIPVLTTSGGTEDYAQIFSGITACASRVAGAATSKTTSWFKDSSSTGWGATAVSVKSGAAGSPYTMAAGTGTVALAGQAAGLAVGPWEIVGVGTSVQVTGTAHALTLPAGVQQGDLLVAVISSRIASTTSITLPSGGEWTTCAEQKTNNILTTGSAVASGLMAYCVRGASDPNLTFTHPTAPSVALGRIVAYRGGYTGGWLDQSTSATTAISTTAVSVTGVTTLFANDLIVVGLCGGQEAAWSAVDATNPSVASGATDTTTRPTANTWIERAEQVTTTGADTSLAIADGVRATAGATGNITATASVAASHVVLVGAFRPKLVSLAPYTMVADTGTVTLAGQTVVPKVALPVSTGTLTLGGQAATLRYARKMPAGTGTLALAGQATTLSYIRKIKMAVVTCPMPLAGQDVVLRAVRKLVAGQGALALAGQPVALKRSYVMPAGTGTLTLVGETVILTKSAAVMHYSMPADPGTLTLAGQASAFRSTRKLTAGTGALTLAGQTVVPRVTLPVGTGTLTLGGQAANLRAVRKVTAGTGALALAGQAAALRSVRKLTAGTGTLTLSGQTIVPRVTLPASTGTLTLGGQPAILRVAHKLAAGTGTLTVSGRAVVLDWSATGATSMPAETGGVLLEGQPVNLAYARKMTAAFGTVALSGQVVTLRSTRNVTVDVGTLTLAGQSANLVHMLAEGYVLDADPGMVVLAGRSAELSRTLIAAPPLLEAQPGRLNFGRKVSIRRW